MKKFYLTIVICILTGYGVFGQTLDFESIYSKAIFEYSNASKDGTIYLEAPVSISASLTQDRIEELNVVLIDWENQKSIYRENNNKLTHHKIFPAKVENDNMVITIIPYSGVRKGNKYDLKVGGGIDMVFKFNCEINEFELSEMKAWGI